MPDREALSDQAERERQDRVREGYVLAHEAGGHAKYGVIEGCPLCVAPMPDDDDDDLWPPENHRDAVTAAEIDRLRAEVERLKADAQTFADTYARNMERVRAENEALKAQVKSHRAMAMERDDFLYRIGKISREYEARLDELSGSIDEREAT